MAKVCSSPQLSISSPPDDSATASTTTCRNMTRYSNTQSNTSQPAEKESPISPTGRGGKRHGGGDRSGAAWTNRRKGSGDKNDRPDRRRGGGGHRGGGQAGTVAGKFLFGGTTRDPLNLGAITESNTPRQSPQATPQPYATLTSNLVVPVSRPMRLDSRDPLGLLTVDSGKQQTNSRKSRGKRRRTRRGSHHGSSTGTARGDNSRVSDGCVSDGELKLDASSTRRRSRSRSASVEPLKKRFRTQSAAVYIQPQTACSSGCTAPMTSSAMDTTSVTQVHPTHTPKVSATAPQPAKQTKPAAANINKPPKDRFRYGNYDRYYGKRLTESAADPRLALLEKHWFEGKRVLDIGCNVGCVTVHIANKLAAKHVVGIDIDRSLIDRARRYIGIARDKQMSAVSKYPASFNKLFGPLTAPSVSCAQTSTSAADGYPANCAFFTSNYVLDNDNLLKSVQPEYDVILALSITKWIHLNWRDDGLKRFFRRIFANLNPGGCLILEPQPFDTYKKRMKLTEEIRENYSSIEFKPEMFTDYLLNDVGFTTCHKLSSGQAMSDNKGFQRPLYRFVKASAQSSVPNEN